MGSRVVNASWDRPSPPNGPINYYLVTVSRNGNVSVIRNISVEKVTLRGLSPYSEYSISVTAINILNDKKRSSSELQAFFKTKDERKPFCLQSRE